MGCWVVPAVAAELWGIPLSQVMEAIRSGALFWKNEDGFLLIDADPKGAAAIRKVVPKEQRPATYTPVVTAAEMSALMQEPAAPAAEPAQEQFDWQVTRRRVAQQRRAPRIPHAAVAAR